MDDDQSTLSTLLKHLAAVIAAVTGLLYLAGITTMWVRMRDAGLGTPDILPLFSLDQLLRIGLTWLTPAVPVLLILGAALVASIVFESWLDKRAALFQAGVEATLPEPDRAQWVADLKLLRKRTDWNGILKKLDEARKARPRNEQPREWSALRLRLGLFQAWTGLIVVALVASIAFLPIGLAILTSVGFVLAAALSGTRPAALALAPLYAVIVAAFLANAIFNPRPLPLVTVITKQDPGGRSGDYVVTSDNAMYIGQGDGRVFGVGTDKLKCWRITSRPRTDPLWRVVADEPSKEPKPPRLRCK